MIFFTILITLIPLVVVFLTIQYGFLIPPKNGLPVLMYHKVLPGSPDGLTVTPEQFDLHLTYLRHHGYQSMSFKTLKSMMKDGAPLPKKAIILTFDDAYDNFRIYALPVLKKHRFTATVFVPVGFIGKTNIWDKGNDPIMTADDLKHIAFDENIEIGLHSFLHQNYGELAPHEMKDDLNNCDNTLRQYGIPFSRVLAYPYGGYPKRNPILKAQMISFFQQARLDFALRIGNNINSWPIRNPYEIKRIDIKGNDSFFIFKTKVLKGRAKLFS